MKQFLTLALTCFPLLCIGAPTYTTYFNNTHTYTNATVAGAARVGSLVSTNGITGQDLTADRAAFTDSNKKLVSTGTSAALSGALSDETGSGAAVFGTSPAFSGPVTFTHSASTTITLTPQFGQVQLDNVGATIGCNFGPAGPWLGSGATLGWGSSARNTGGSIDTILVRDGAANTLALRNGTAAQAFNVYNTYTDASNYERGVFQWTSNTLRVGTDNLGTGTSRNLQFYTKGAGIIQFAINNGVVWNINGSGHLLAQTDNTYDIGAAAATRPRFVHVARTTVSGVTSPAQITADQNNYNPGAQGKFLRLSTDASRTLTGLTFTTAQVDGEEHWIINVGSQDIVIAHESASSTAGNRFLSTTGANLTLTANQQAALWYDGTTARWRVSKQN